MQASRAHDPGGDTILPAGCPLRSHPDLNRMKASCSRDEFRRITDPPYRPRRTV